MSQYRHKHIMKRSFLLISLLVFYAETTLASIPWYTEPTDPPMVEPTDPPMVEPTDPPMVEPTDPPMVEPTDPPMVEPTDPAPVPNHETHEDFGSGLSLTEVNTEPTDGTESVESRMEMSATDTTSQEVTFEARPTTEFVPPKPSCYKDKDCGFKRFCHRHYGRCENCMRERQLCRRRGMCCKGMECRYGVCTMPIKLGLQGSKCKADRDCDGDSCCAKFWGRNVCKPRLPKGYKCHPPQGGLMWSLNSHCQCQTGLVCASRMEYATMNLFGYTIILPFQLPVPRCRTYEEVGVVNNQTTTMAPTTWIPPL